MFCHCIYFLICNKKSDTTKSGNFTWNSIVLTPLLFKSSAPMTTKIGKNEYINVFIELKHRMYISTENGFENPRAYCRTENLLLMLPVILYLCTNTMRKWMNFPLFSYSILFSTTTHTYNPTTIWLTKLTSIRCSMFSVVVLWNGFQVPSSSNTNTYLYHPFAFVFENSVFGLFNVYNVYCIA